MTELFTVFDVIFRYISGGIDAGMLIICITVLTIIIFSNVFAIISKCTDYIIISSVVSIIIIIFSIIPINIIIFGNVKGNGTEFINENIGKIEYAGCATELVLYDGNILHFSAINYHECLNKIEMKKFNDKIRKQADTIKDTNGVKETQ